MFLTLALLSFPLGEKTGLTAEPTVDKLGKVATNDLSPR